MPVIELNLNRVKKIISGNVTKKRVVDTLPFLGLDIESQDGDKIRIEYSPNRPDYSTDFGIALGLEGLLGIKKGIQKTNIKKQGKFEIKVDPSVSKIRPFVTGVIGDQIDHKPHPLKPFYKCLKFQTNPMLRMFHQGIIHIKTNRSDPIFPQRLKVDLGHHLYHIRGQK